MYKESPGESDISLGISDMSKTEINGSLRGRQGMTSKVM